jgi:hypothetical protein
MTVIYRPFRGKSVSREWAVVLNAAAEAGVSFQLNSGHRTMAEQQRLVDQLGVFNAVTNPHGAARPSATAPHIRVGRIDHALDVDDNDGSADRLAAWLRGKGAHPAFPIGSEPWHLELPADELRALSRTLGGYTESERRWMREYDQLKHADRGEERRRVLRRVMKRQRKRIWRAAQPASKGGDGRGWNHANRRARYRSLLARTK